MMVAPLRWEEEEEESWVCHDGSSPTLGVILLGFRSQIKPLLIIILLLILVTIRLILIATLLLLLP